MLTIAGALKAAMADGLARLDAQLLLLHALGRAQGDRAWLIAHDADALGSSQHESYAGACARRLAGEPLAYIVGEKEFYGLRLRVDPRVLVPRPETETLVDWALALMEKMGSDHNFASTTSGRAQGVPTKLGSDPISSALDLGTGSGCIALALKHHCPGLEVHASDASEAALEVARANAQSLHLDIRFHRAPWLHGHTTRHHLIVSNPPYIAERDPHLRALAHEPGSALVSGPDGLADIRAIVSQASACLHAGGWLLLEHGHDQAARVRELLTQAGFRHAQSRRDLAGIERCTGGQWLELG